MVVPPTLSRDGIDEEGNSSSKPSRAAPRAAEAAGPKAALLIARRLLGDFVFMKGAIIAGYAAIGSEVDPFPLMAALNGQGHPLCLPRTEDEGPHVSRLETGRTADPRPHERAASPQRRQRNAAPIS